MKFELVDFSLVNTYIDMALGLLAIGGAIFFSTKITKNKLSVIFCISLSVFIFVSWLINLYLSFYLCFGFLVAYLVCATMNNLPKLRSYFTKSGTTRAHSSIQKKNAPSKIFDHQSMEKKLYETVLLCSKQKIGAIITFEKNDSLTNIASSGTPINAPMSSELLMTIFYPGTRLHDGAVIIRDDTILAASVYYTPTTKPLTGKYGSRHRAAIGISEICDAVTVVVSEETGRISIAHNSDIEPVSIDNFIRQFEDAMGMNKK